MEYSRYYNWWRRFSGKAALAVRKQVFDLFMREMNPRQDTAILDVGVTNNIVNEADNFFEAMYPWPSKITATGFEDASYLEKKYPGLTFVRADGKSLPFADKSFDIVFSSAVLEHVGSRENQKKFIEELSRVGKSIFFTTPNRFFPIEVHTGLPLLHFLPPVVYRKILRFLGLGFFADEKNLNLLDARQVRELVPDIPLRIVTCSTSLVAIARVREFI